ncbi:GerAB/ArcD/ProY family transporter [Paenibacillus spongiae]|uniref:Endospore germination permease n=1 Tax=Paenibacillus spongiae TaxID=2909671 RepID=A0ABY5S8D5_9BACL|nr:endospore germination permease [Paenibacillus spongiae]UVI28588.1 endospore germination permease [Paenibacillus spongiae]
MKGTPNISARQFMILVFLYSVGTVILHTPGPLTEFAKQDAWLAALIGTVFGLALVWLYIKVGQLYPELTLDQLNEKIFGKWLGKAVNFTFFLWAYSTAAQVVYYVGNFVKTFWMPETPLTAFNILFTLIILMAVRLGIEPIVRSAEILVVPFTILTVVLILCILPQVDMKNLTPMLEEGAKPVFRGALFYMSVFSLSPVIFLMIYPAVNRSKAAGKAFYIGTLAGGIVLIIGILLTTLVLGPELMALNTAPSYSLAKMITIGNFLTRIEAVLAFLWIITTFFRAVMYFYVSVAVFANLFKLNDYRPLVSPLGMIMVALSLIIFPNVQVSGEFNKEIWLFYASSYGLIMPLLLLIVGTIRMRVLHALSPKNG